MKIVFLGFLLTFMWGGCSNGQHKAEQTKLPATEFVQKIAATEKAQVVDVRTPGEFRNGHLANALNVDVRGKEFQSQVSALDKQQPVFVYCLSGARSASAAAAMRKMGFEQVYEMPGGMMEWRAQGLPEVKGKTTSGSGMTRQQYDALLASDKQVLVDFYADWCAPCRKMKPFLEKIAGKASDRVELVRINADENPELCGELGVTGLPTLRLYRKKEMVWDHVGFIDEDGVRAQLELH